MSATRGVPARGARQPARRPLDDHARPGRQRREPARVVADVLDRDAQPPPVRRGRQRERMRLPPVPARQEAPVQRLARAHRQALEPHAADLDRDDPRRLGHHALDPQPVAQRARDGEHQPQADQRPQRDGVQRPPVRAGDGLALELPAGGELMAEAQRDREVGRDVQRVPHAVGEPAADGHDRADDDDHQQAEPDGGQQHARVAREQVVGLAGQRDAVVERVAGRDEHGVGEQQREAGDAVDAGASGSCARARPRRARGCAPAAAARRAPGRRRAAR